MGILTQTRPGQIPLDSLTPEHLTPDFWHDLAPGRAGQVFQRTADGVQWSDTTLSPIKPIIVQITVDDFSNRRILLGSVPAGMVVFLVQVDILQAFNGDARLTIGDLSAEARLLTVDDMTWQLATFFVHSLAVRYENETPVYLFLPSGTPTTGQATLTIFMQ